MWKVQTILGKCGTYNDKMIILLLCSGCITLAPLKVLFQRIDVLIKRQSSAESNELPSINVYFVVIVKNTALISQKISVEVRRCC